MPIYSKHKIIKKISKAIKQHKQTAHSKKHISNVRKMRVGGSVDHNKLLLLTDLNTKFEINTFYCDILNEAKTNYENTYKFFKQSSKPSNYEEFKNVNIPCYNAAFLFTNLYKKYNYIYCNNNNNVNNVKKNAEIFNKLNTEANKFINELENLLTQTNV